MSPCNTSDGWLKKKWKIIDTKRYLIKAGSNPFMQEPINEAFGTRLHQRLGCKNYVSYNVYMKILYGTTNKGKLQAMKIAVKSLDIELIGLNDLDSELPYINENGNTLLENAEIKAKAYYDAFHMPVFSCDSGLYFDELHR